MTDARCRAAVCPRSWALVRLQSQLIDGEIFRIRKHFASHGLAEAAVIIERRARTRQIRLGLSRVRVERR